MGDTKDDVETVRMSRRDSARLAEDADRLKMSKSDLLTKGWRAYVARADSRRRKRAEKPSQDI